MKVSSEDIQSDAVCDEETKAAVRELFFCFMEAKHAFRRKSALEAPDAEPRARA